MYIYQGKKIFKPLYIHFLCGNKYQKDSDKDKRNVLKSYIDKKSNNYALILESLFEPIEYKNMGFKDLEEVELMASHYARSVIIFHETVSTAAEIALFGSKYELKNKILVIYAPQKIVALDTVGAFIRLAYFQNNKVKHNSYMFSTDLFPIEDGIGYYETFFENNILDQKIIKKLNIFWSNIKETFNIELKRKIVNVNFQNTYEITNHRINIILSYHFIMSFVICTLINNSLIKDKREKDLCVRNICEFLKEVLKSTIEKKEVLNLNDYKMSIKTHDKKEINLPIRFCIYLLDKAGFIYFQDEELHISNDFKNKCKEYNDLITIENEPNFFNKEGDVDGI